MAHGGRGPAQARRARRRRAPSTSWPYSTVGGVIAAFREMIKMTEGVHDWCTGFAPTIPWATFSPDSRGGQEVVEANLIAAIMIEKEQARWLNGKI